MIIKILKYCNLKKIPVTPCGARTGLSGGSLPVFGEALILLALIIIYVNFFLVKMALQLAKKKLINKIKNLKIIIQILEITMLEKIFKKYKKILHYHSLCSSTIS